MKARVIVFALSLLGVVGCADKPHRSRKAKAEEPVLKTDSIQPIRLMYGVPYRTFEVREVDSLSAETKK